MNLLGIASAGIEAAADRFDKTASRVARAGTGLPGSDGDLARDMVDQISEQAALTANVRTAHTGDEMLGTVINIVA